jgi:hypothetical protein
METGQWIAIGLSVGLGAWFVGGFLWNRRQGETILRWLREGLAQFGALDEIERAGRPANAFRLAAGRARAPFQRAEAIFLLEPRENLPLWLYKRLQGQRDELILRFTLRAAPGFEVETARAEDQEFRKQISGEPKRPYQLVPGPHGFEIAHRGKLDSDGGNSLRSFLEQYGSAITRLSIHHKEPHLLLRARLPFLLTCPPEAFFRDFGILPSAARSSSP